MFLVTGATGNVGRHVVERLVARGEKVRALVRDPRRAVLPVGVEVVEGDLSRPETLDAALDCVTGVFLFAVPGSGPAFVEAAQRAGVERVVLLSSNGVDDTAAEQANPIAAYHAEIEQALRGGKPAWTFLRSAHMATNALPWAGQIRAGDVVRAPYAGATSAPIHEADLAEVAVVALTEDGHAGQVYPLSGPASLTAAEQVTLIGEALGRPLVFEELTPEVAREQMSRFMPPFILNTLFEQWEQSVGNPAPVYDTVERLTGRPARAFAQWAADRVADFS
ncbi:NAD(P)H-binding protein [Nonomuraea sp. NPDC050691]|uniref:NAD(P)H-binding protein n=1 Tax=Nonomuraea sp. NPDC050691 TaxID=3155661 RepID=UPI0033E284CC